MGLELFTKNHKNTHLALNDTLLKYRYGYGE